MNKFIDFYFDFISPYSFLAYKKLKILNEYDKLNINYKPILLGGLHKLSGITAPAFNERKMKNMKFDCELIAKKNNIEFIWNDKFPLNTLYLMRGYLVIDKKTKDKFFELCFDAYWRNNVDILDTENVKDILKKCSIDQKKFFEEVSKPDIKNELKELTNKAFEKDIFGAPTFIVNDKIFWGQDRLDYAIDEFKA